jgi:biopolymer transport protein ExbB
MNRKYIIGVFAALSALTSFQHASAADGDWFDDKLKIRKEIIVNPGPKGAGLDATTPTFPFALRLSEQTVAFSDLKDDGSDLRVTGPDGKRVDHYVESIDPKAGLAVVWVRGTNLDPRSAQNYHLYYGGDAKSVADASAVFDSSELLFMDFSGGGKDRTRNGNDAVGAVPSASGFAGQSANLTGAPIRIAASTSLASAAGAPFTLMMWVKAAQPQNAVLAHRGAGLVLSLAGGQVVAQVGGVQIVGTTPLAPAAWTHVALVGRADGRIDLFIGGNLAGSGQGATPALGDDLIVGEGFTGQIDNLRYAAAERSAAYVGAVALSDNGRGLVTYGPEATRSGKFEVGYFITVVTNVTLEGWVVIGLCGIMLALAIWVMITKSSLVSRIEKQNEAFDDAYGLAAGLDSQALRTEAEREKVSTLAQIYLAGMHEVELRSKSGPARFTGASIEALKARIDGVLTNQTYRLSHRMVLLTLAISGGPFLGLLGTVIGVMITFAAIAAEGNVNVNSIAPGVAAALLATAAGLMVAIPALFGYNIILTRIKRINASGRSFADTLVARLAEQYGA